MPAVANWLGRRLFPLLATAILLAVGMVSTTWWGADLVGKHAWQLPYDLWGTMVAANRMLHLHLGGLYTKGTALITFPGAALMLVPVVALIDVAGFGLVTPSPHNSHPDTWLLAGPYQIILSCLALFAADAIAERLGVSRPKRALLAAASAIALWNVSIRWGHPEDAVAVALLLYGVLAVARARPGRAGWLIGAAIAIQPLVLLAVPVALAAVATRRLPGFVIRAAVPSAVLLAVVAAANWHATFQAITSQPNWPTVDHATPWTSFAPKMSDGAVAAGPGRLVAVLLACGCGLVVARRWRRRDRLARWSPEALRELLWWVALALALRCVFESVMVAFYIWPVLAAALIAATASWRRLLATGIATSVLTFVAQADWHGPWLWWSVVVAGLGVVLVLAGPPRRDADPPPPPAGQPGELTETGAAA